MSDVVFCEQCGSVGPPAARFCASCGSPQELDPPLAAAESSGAIAPLPGDLAPESDPTTLSGDLSPEPHPVVTFTGALGASQRDADAGASGDAGAHAPASESRSESSTAAAAADPRPVMAGQLPIELWLVILAFAIPGGWLVFMTLKALPDSLQLLGAQFFGFRIGLALTLIIVLVGLLGVGMLAISWKLYQRDRVGRGLAYVFCGVLAVSVIGAGGGSSAETIALLCSIGGIGILALSPRVQEVFNSPMSADGAPTSIIVSRVVIAIFCASGALTAITYLLLASENGRFALVAIGIGAATIFASRTSARLMEGNPSARQQLTIGGVGLAVLMIAFGQSAPGLLVSLGLVLGAIGMLWIPNDARVYFGDAPIAYASSS